MYDVLVNPRIGCSNCRSFPLWRSGTVVGAHAGPVARLFADCIVLVLRTEGMCELFFGGGSNKVVFRVCVNCNVCVSCGILAECRSICLSNVERVKMGRVFVHWGCEHQPRLLGVVFLVDWGVESALTRYSLRRPLFSYIRVWYHVLQCFVYWMDWWVRGLQ